MEQARRRQECVLSGRITRAGSVLRDLLSFACDDGDCEGIAWRLDGALSRWWTPRYRWWWCGRALVSTPLLYPRGSTSRTAHTSTEVRTREGRATSAPARHSRRSAMAEAFWCSARCLALWWCNLTQVMARLGRRPTRCYIRPTVTFTATVSLHVGGNESNRLLWASKVLCLPCWQCGAATSATSIRSCSAERTGHLMPCWQCYQLTPDARGDAQCNCCIRLWWRLLLPDRAQSFCTDVSQHKTRLHANTVFTPCPLRFVLDLICPSLGGGAARHRPSRSPAATSAHPSSSRRSLNTIQTNPGGRTHVLVEHSNVDCNTALLALKPTRPRSRPTPY
jgi:hypothetical protein